MSLGRITKLNIMNEVTIIVAGKVGSGKTTVAQIIEQALKDKGVKKLRFYDNEKPHPESFPARVKTVAEKAEIVIKTVLTKRDLTLDESHKGF